MPLGDRDNQVLTLITREGDEYRRENLGGVRFVPLVGQHGFPK